MTLPASINNRSLFVLVIIGVVLFWFGRGMLGLSMLPYDSAQIHGFATRTGFPEYRSVGVYVTNNAGSTVLASLIVYDPRHDARVIRVRSPDQIGTAEVNVYIKRRHIPADWALERLTGSQAVWVLQHLDRCKITPDNPKIHKWFESYSKR